MPAGEFGCFLGSLDGDHFVAKRLESAANQAQVDGGVAHRQNGWASGGRRRGLPRRGVRFASLAGALLGRQESFDLPYKRFGINRLGNVAVESRREDFVAVSDHGQGGDSHDWDFW